MDLAATEEGHQRVADLLERETALDRFWVVLRHLDRVRVAEEIGGVKEVDVENVALDPLPAVEKPSELADRSVDLHPQGPFHRVARAHLVGDWADPADAGRDVRRLEVGAPPKERLEEAWRLEDLQLDVLDPVVLDTDRERTLALDAREIVDGDRSFRHGVGTAATADSLALRKAGAFALNVRNSRPTAGESMPRVLSLTISEFVFGAGCGPKHP
jgi:hypothetical protein